jgi:hypothetical protein
VRASGWAWIVGMALAALASPPAAAQGYQPPRHLGASPLFDGMSPEYIAALADGGVALEHDRAPADVLAEHRRLAGALAALQPQRRGTVDAYVVAVALDSDPVFGREAREAARVLARRYDAAGRTLVLGGSDGTGPSDLPMGSPANIAAALARIAELMDGREDVLVLYTTSHGAPIGIVYNDGDQGVGAISPARLWQMLSALGIENRLVLLSACFSGVFVPMLQSPTTAVVTAASADRTSFGCQADNDWTFFGDALVNHALRKAQPLAAAAAQAQATIAGWEGQGRLTPSHPQVAIGADVSRWLAPLEARMPRGETPPVGRPATAILPSR